MKTQITLPDIKVSTEVIQKPKCIGCLNISAGNSPIGFYRDEGVGKLDAEHQWFGLDGERITYIVIHFCPVCGRSLKELAVDPAYPSP